jgi:uncharacterized membrane protein YphA (DoxX/SURF4 family)
MTTARAAVAAVWLYEGLWCKLLRADPNQESIVASVPGLPAACATAALRGIGATETALGIWVLSGARPRLAASVQSGLLVGFNAGGLAFANDRIAEPRRMLTRNAALLALVWLLARQPVRR